jgi:hypothetical protein
MNFGFVGSQNNCDLCDSRFFKIILYVLLCKKLISKQGELYVGRKATYPQNPREPFPCSTQQISSTSSKNAVTIWCRDDVALRGKDHLHCRATYTLLPDWEELAWLFWGSKILTGKMSARLGLYRDNPS